MFRAGGECRMKMAVLKEKGVKIKHTELGTLSSDVAVQIKDEDKFLAEKAGCVVFDEVIKDGERKTLREVFGNGSN